MEDGLKFVDYYEILQVNTDCDTKTLESAYRYFAKLYHPDQAPTADVEKFSELTEAYRVLRDPGKRAEYNRTYFLRTNKPTNQFSAEKELQTDEKTPLSDAEIHEKILLSLYKRRREHASDPGIVGWLLQEALKCSEDNFEFHVWYLRSKGFIEMTEHGTLAVTIQGVDHVISMCRTNLSEKLQIAQSDSAED